MIIENIKLIILSRLPQPLKKKPHNLRTEELGMFGIAKMLQLLKIHMDPGRKGFGANIIHFGQLVFVVGFDFRYLFILKCNGHYPGGG